LTSSCIFGFFINIATKNTNVVKIYVNKLFGPNFIKVDIKDIKYIIPTGILQLRAAAIIANPNGVIVNIILSVLIPTIEIIKVIVYKIIFCTVNRFFNINFNLSFLFTSIFSLIFCSLSFEMF